MNTQNENTPNSEEIISKHNIILKSIKEIFNKNCIPRTLEQIKEDQEKYINMIHDNTDPNHLINYSNNDNPNHIPNYNNQENDEGFYDYDDEDFYDHDEDSYDNDESLIKHSLLPYTIFTTSLEDTGNTIKQLKHLTEKFTQANNKILDGLKIEDELQNDSYGFMIEEDKNTSKPTLFAQYYAYDKDNNRFSSVYKHNENTLEWEFCPEMSIFPDVNNANKTTDNPAQKRLMLLSQNLITLTVKTRFLRIHKREPNSHDQNEIIRIYNAINSENNNRIKEYNERILSYSSTSHLENQKRVNNVNNSHNKNATSEKLNRPILIRRIRDKVSNFNYKIRSNVSDMSDKVGSNIPNISDKARSKISNFNYKIRSNASDMSDKVRSNIPNISDKARSKISNFNYKIRSNASDMSDKVRSKISKIKDINKDASRKHAMPSSQLHEPSASKLSNKDSSKTTSR